MDVQKVPQGMGSGFFWDDKGHIVTNYHVIKGAADIKVALIDQSVWSAKVCPPLTAGVFYTAVHTAGCAASTPSLLSGQWMRQVLPQHAASLQLFTASECIASVACCTAFSQPLATTFSHLHQQHVPEQVTDCLTAAIALS